MKKIYLAALCLLAAISSGYANPGDTTWVQANTVQLDYYNNFDTTVLFPDGSLSYRKIYMIFTLGEYNCPTGSQYCHQWDYTVQNYLMTPGGDTIELSRLITPFANSGWPRFPSTWKQPYVFDVTDFYPLLKNSATTRIHYSGYSGGFTADVKFAFIEGVPDRNVTGVEKLYDGSYTYGDAGNPINSHFPTLTKTAPAGTESASLKFLVTGHGSGANGCCEFASHAYDVNLNSTSVAHKDIWRDDCGLNDLYPQGGTWIYDRGGWCPGAMVRPNYHDLPNITGGNSYDVNIQFSNYAIDTPGGSYTTSAALIYHAGFNKNLDASLEDIIAPSKDPNHFRKNPSGSIPTIRIHNAGSTPITSMEISYGVKDSIMQQYSWAGTLAPLSDMEIDLPELNALTNMSLSGASGMYQFEAMITSVNGQTDEDNTNNKLISDFVAAPNWPADMAISFKTSNLAQQDGGWYYGNPQQNWQITNMQGNVVAERINTDQDQIYFDWVSLPEPGIYKLTINSGNCAGLHWWPFDGESTIHQGYFKLTNQQNGALIPMNNYTYSGTPHDDFGCKFEQYFSVSTAGTGIADMKNQFDLNVYPNPATSYINIDVIGELREPANLQLINILGQVIYELNTQQKNISIPVGQFAAGIYTLQFKSGEKQKIEKVVITR
jgi:hypothetical protein